MKKNIVIIGTGKLAFALTAGILLAIKQGKIDAHITIVGRNTDTLEKFLSFKSSKVETSTNYACVRNADYCIICIVPTGAYESYPKIGKAFESFGIPKTVISITSGVDVTLASKFLEISNSNIVCGTTTTNVAYGNGYTMLVGSNEHKSRLPDAVEFFSLLGEVVTAKKYKEVYKVILLAGSGNAFHAALLKEALHFEKEKGSNLYQHIYLEKLVKFLERTIEENDLNDYFKLADTSFQKSVAGYLNAVANYALYLGYSELESLSISTKTMLLTVKSLLENRIDDKHFDIHIKAVITKGGCTEKVFSNFIEMLSRVFDTELAEPNFENFSESYMHNIDPAYRYILKFSQLASK